MHNNFFYTVKKQDNYAINVGSLYDLYLPIVSNNAISLYMLLFNNTENSNKNNGLTFDLNGLLSFLQIDFDAFEQARSKLEAIGLLQTYLGNDLLNKIYIFIINKPLSFHDFISNFSYKQLLINKIGTSNYEYLEYKNTGSNIAVDGTNISHTFDMIYNNDATILSFDFNELYAQMAKRTGSVIILDDKCKETIVNYSSKYTLSLSLIESAIYETTNEHDNQFICDNLLLSKKLAELITNDEIIKHYNNYQIKRDFKLFKNLLTNEQKQIIMKEYISYNSYQYYQLIIKQKLTIKENNIIKSLLRDFSLTDKIINILIDYSLFKTHGKLNKTYLSKMANTINCLSITDVQQAVEHLINFTLTNGFSNEFNKKDISKNEESLDDL